MRGQGAKEGPKEGPKEKSLGPQRFVPMIWFEIEGQNGGPRGQATRNPQELTENIFRFLMFRRLCSNQIMG